MAGIAGSGILPQDEAAARELIDFFVMQKTLYEIGYELGEPARTGSTYRLTARLPSWPDPLPTDLLSAAAARKPTDRAIAPGTNAARTELTDVLPAPSPRLSSHQGPDPDGQH